MNWQQGDAVAETPIHGYVLAKYGNGLTDSELLSHLICRALRANKKQMGRMNLFNNFDSAKD
ncbi:hypothetical protein KCP73_22735 [Salmonella enterica subsp. enterica]|nr:hypothetical protein KCP73_22735 [Salmonella enterica subsp. enterica]